MTILFVAGTALPPPMRHVKNHSHTVSMSHGAPERRTRRALLRDFAVIAAAAVAGVPQSLAGVDFDIDRFGDKELKVSTINKVKQNCRNVLSERPELLPAFFMLSVKDALSYDAATNAGGPNGSLRFELDEAYNADVRDAAAAIVDIRKLQREDMSFADTCAFAGATAIEAAGGPRIKVQLGREDARNPDPPGKSALYTSSASASDLKECFANAGLEPARDVVLLHGAIGALSSIASARLEELAAIADDEFDSEDDEFDLTYGRVTTKKRGAVLVSSNVSMLTLGGKKFSNAYLRALLTQDNTELSDRDRAILGNEEMRAQVSKYASSNNKFVNDLGDLFERMTLLGSSYESLKLEDK